MQEIKGRCCSAISYASQIEESAIEQIRQMCDQEFAQDSKIRIMPDAHTGIGCTIGTTMTVTDKIVPNLVGVDIGCGMYTMALGETPLNLAALDAACYEVPHGLARGRGGLRVLIWSSFAAIECLRTCVVSSVLSALLVEAIILLKLIALKAGSTIL